MRKLTILVMVLGLLMGAGVIAQAANDGAVAVTYTVGQSLSMTVEPNIWEAGSGAAGSVLSTFNSTAGYFTVTNLGNGTSYMDIKGSISGGCSLGAAAGANIYRIGHGQATGSGPYTEAATYSEITTLDTNLATILAGASNTYKFDLQLRAPTSTTYGGVEQTITVTITAKTS